MDTVAQELIKRRRLQMLVHSYLYYKRDVNLISDLTFDQWANELAKLQKDYPKESRAVLDFYEDFKDWDGSTGAYLPLTNPWVEQTGNRLLRYTQELNNPKPAEMMKGLFNASESPQRLQHPESKQPPRETDCKEPKRAKATQQRSNALF